jgi:hypothetical protein
MREPPDVARRLVSLPALAGGYDAVTNRLLSVGEFGVLLFHRSIISRGWGLQPFRPAAGAVRRGRSIKVACWRDTRAATPWKRKCSSRGPHESDHRCLNADTMPAAASARRDAGNRIEADRTLRLASVEVAHVIDARARDGVQDVECEIAVRIDHGDALPCQDVAQGQVVEECRFAAAGFADNVEVTLALLAREYNRRSAGGRRNGCRLGLHNVAPASGENARCQCRAHLPFVRFCSLWERSGAAARRATYGEA